MHSRGIRKVVLFPGDSDYVGYANASFTPECQPVTNDTILHLPSVDSALDAVLQASLSSSDSAERQGIIFRNTTTNELLFQLITPSYADICEVRWDIPSTPSGYAQYATYHSHPLPPNAWVTCPSDPPGTPPGRVNPNRWGGGSQADWQTVDSMSSTAGYNVPGYIIDATHTVWRLDWHVTNKFGTNSNKWSLNASGCFQ